MYEVSTIFPLEKFDDIRRNARDLWSCDRPFRCIVTFLIIAPYKYSYLLTYLHSISHRSNTPM